MPAQTSGYDGIMMVRMEPGTVLRADRVITPDRELSPAWVAVEDGKISDCGEGGGPAGGESHDLAGLTLVPGFVDLHVHGGGGFSFDTGRVDDLDSFRGWVSSTRTGRITVWWLGPFDIENQFNGRT